MTKSITIYRSDNENPLLKLDHVTLYFLVNQTCCWILDDLKTYWETGNLNLSGQKYLRSMAEHGYTNHFLMGVKLVEHILLTFKKEDTDGFGFDYELMAKTMIEFKKYKDTERQKEIAEMGENWGSQALYTLWNPTECLKGHDELESTE